MSESQSRWVGNVLTAFGALGLAFGLLGMIVLPFALPPAIDGAADSVSAVGEGVEAVSASLELALGAIDSATQVLITSSDGLQDLDSTLQGTKPLIDDVSGLVGEEAPATIDRAREALESAVDGARAIDRVLRGLAALGAITGISYSPQIALDEGLSSAIEGLDPLPDSLRSIQGNLDSASSQLAVMGGDLRVVSDSLERFARDLMTVREDLTGQNTELERFGTQLTDLAERIRGATILLVVLAEAGVAWFAATQGSVLLVGKRLREEGV